MSTRWQRCDERMIWVLRRIANPLHGGRGTLVAWDEDVVDDFVDEFPEAEKTLKVYTLGPNSCPMLNRAAQRAYARGYLTAGTIGNMDARSFNQRTWCRCWSITDAGRVAITAGDRAK